ncbi:hypothetical protein F751_6547 [Auxenochlorella protothecoides]|uniref:Nudix hydrolase domain-containing protein n=1 Tax=Auxenochlorella protothecoides TaxID=3075 RepID=A0A087STH4_AUXPR|nr:hypothetical protein F751_6547 [Auxenochlorella protothecoides]KFM29028.1 hypothetical protein F751_6547 [Auxenochlorella protothecoides]RMZ54948.1 hypothetical protein APUTEX25_000465 [Auxenochlorella protothecoides]|eukprot:RMZ54948.1 hypothetical protein APUTEX25_000465 [Auxenochlorella protothecoides]
MPPLPGPIEKQGAGLLFTSEQHVLLLKRANTKHNLGAWGLPGGNVEAGDESLLATAVREAVEEVGVLPPFTISGEIKTARGKRGQKHFTVFIATLLPEDRQAWTPVLNHEHSEFQWYPVPGLCAGTLPLHPVVDKLFRQGELPLGLVGVAPP